MPLILNANQRTTLSTARARARNDGHTTRVKAHERVQYRLPTKFLLLARLDRLERDLNLIASYAEAFGVGPLDRQALISARAALTRIIAATEP